MQIDLVDCLSLEGVWIDAVAEDKYGIIDELVTRVMQSEHLASLSALSTETVVHLVREREDEKATGLERGVAFPHARIPGLDRAALGFAILPSPTSAGQSRRKVISGITPVVASRFNISINRP